MLAMLARLGHVIHWAACLLASAVAVFVLYSMLLVPDPLPFYRTNHYMALCFAGGVWVTGRAIRYVLAGPVRKEGVWYALVHGLAPILWGAAALIITRSLTTQMGLSPGLAWLCAAFVGAALGFLVMVWGVRDLIFVVPFRGNTFGQSFWGGFYGAYALERARQLDGSRSEPKTWAEDDPSPER